VVLALHLPGALDKGVAPEVVPRLPLFLKPLLDDVLRRDAGVVGAGYPQRRLAAHAVIADDDILEGVIEPCHWSTPVTFGGG
jgi:hypothetical protein